MSARPAINSIAQTPNGPGRLVSTYYLPGDGPMDPPSGLLIRHPKEMDIDHAKCVEVVSQSGASGWLAVYKVEEVTP